MYHTVNQKDIEWESDMDDRQSIYLDTISLTSDYPNRKSLSQSRQTIYHSAEDINTPENGGSTPIRQSSFNRRSSLYRQNRQSYPGVNINNNDAYNHTSSNNNNINNNNNNSNINNIIIDDEDSNDIIITNVAADHLQHDGPPDDHGGGISTSGLNDEVSARLLLYKNNKKMTITYSQWKSRTWRRFQDGIRNVDYVLAYRADDPHPKNVEKRRIFEEHLQSEGLQLEREETQRIHFIKIHAPKEVLFQYSEILKIKMPIKKLNQQEDVTEPEFHLMQSMKSFFGRPFRFIKLDETKFPNQRYQLKYEYTRNNSFLFDVDSPDFFSTSHSIAIVHFILERQRFSEDTETANDIGVEKLLSDGVYQAAYPLHDGDCNLPGSERSLLYDEWAALRKWIKHQPLDNIKEYFGVRVALYYAWLGFYTHMLIPAAIVGLLCFVYGFTTLYSNQISEDICNSNNKILMCPRCDRRCDYWWLSESCTYSRIGYLLDNSLTVVFAVFMSFWAILYLELWKRYSAQLMYRWGMSDFSYQAEHPRPQYLARLQSVKRKKFNVIHRVLEPHVPFWKVKFPIYLMSFSIIFLFISVAVLAVFGVIIYRMASIYSESLFGEFNSTTYNSIVTPVTAALLNLVVITALNYVYDYLAVYLTDMEYRRTQMEYDESLSLKIYLFQFINYYSSIFYIAFLKGKFVGYPAKYNRIFKYRQEECNSGGCLMELCIQLVIIMIGKQALNAILEMLIPFIIKTINTIRTKIKPAESDEEGGDNDSATLISCNQWTNDYKLLPWSRGGLFDEYLEMVIQYGFVTLFVVAFPLAPIFALINNIFEMRLDAKKMLKYYRRPVPMRAKDIGIWFRIMVILGRISVVSSAFIIAFSSNFIPRFVYMMKVSANKTDVGFLNHTLAYFNPVDFEEGTSPVNSTFSDIHECRYSEYRNPPLSDEPYKRPLIYWHILAARLAFIVVFQNIVGLVQMTVAWAIPDVPRKVRDNIKREEFLTREIIIEHEKLRQSQQQINSEQRTSTNIDGGAYPLLNSFLSQTNGGGGGGGGGGGNSKEDDINFRRRKKLNDIENTIV